MAVYNTIAGFVQFDPNERDVNGQSVRDIVVQSVGSGGKNVRITLWPEFGNTSVKKGDFVAAQGKFTEANVSGKTYYNLSAGDLVVLTPSVKAERDVVNSVEDDSDTVEPF